MRFVRSITDILIKGRTIFSRMEKDRVKTHPERLNIIGHRLCSITLRVVFRLPMLNLSLAIFSMYMKYFHLSFLFVEP